MRNLLILPLVLSLGSGCATLGVGSGDNTRLYTYHSGEDGHLTSTWYVVTPRSAIVFDAPMLPVDVTSLQQELRVNTNAPVTDIFITSSAPESWAGAGLLTSLTGATLWSSQATADAIAEDGPTELESLRGVMEGAPMVTVEPSDTFEDERNYWSHGLRMTAWDAGAGPAGAATVIWLPQVETLVCGALVFNGVHPRVQGGRSQVWLETLETLSDVDARRILPGSGAPGGPELIQGAILYLRTLQEEVTRQNPEGVTLSEEVQAGIEDTMMGMWPTWGLSQHLGPSIQDEWVRQGGQLVNSTPEAVLPATEPPPTPASDAASPAQPDTASPAQPDTAPSP